MRSIINDIAKKSWNSPWISGQLIIWSAILLLTSILSAIITLTDMQSSYIFWLCYLINIIALLLGGFVSGRKSEVKGWFFGLMQGIIYLLVVFMLSFLAFDSDTSSGFKLFIIIGCIASSLGGALGINSKN